MRFLIIFITISLIFLAAYSSHADSLERNKSLKKDSTIKKITINNNSFLVEIADDPSEQTKGLMFRQSLEKREGMIFIFPQSKTRYFWMKNTLIPLDIIFIDENKTIINIEKADPCKEDPCANYISKKPASYVLEVLQNTSKELGFEKGDRVEFS